MKKILPLFLLLLPVLFYACSNSDYDSFSTIYGIVSDASTGETIEGATVQLSPGGETKITDAEGYYEFEDVTAQQYTVTVHKTGYSTNRKSVTAIIGEKNQVNITINKTN